MSNEPFGSVGGEKAAFLAALAHDLRSPLNTIIGFSSLLRDGNVDPSPADREEFLDLVLTSARQLQQLINDLLDLTALDDHGVEFFPEPLDLDRVANEVLAPLSAAVASKKLDVNVAVAPGTTDVVLDRTRLKQILHACVSNAIASASPSGRVEVRSIPQDGDSVRIEVECSGAALTEAEAAQLFDPLRPLTTRSKAWLGLALTKGLVEAQGGRVGVERTAEQGCVLYAILPKRYQARAALPGGA